MEHPQETLAPPTSRLAPSPTGDLHLGNVRTFLLNWSLGRNLGWRLILRHEDLDASRASHEQIESIESSMGWLGIDWDGPSIRQSDDLASYRAAMHRLAKTRSVFHSPLSRREIREALNAPHTGGELRFPSSLRPTPGEAWSFTDDSAGHRFAMPPGSETVKDELQGERRFDPAEEIGDPVVWTRDGRPAYQLAVVVDDHEHGVTDVFRGEDLLPSAARQQRLARSLDFEPAPRWWHVPLVTDGDGRRLAKRDGDRGLHGYMSAGVMASRIIGLLAYRSGLQDIRRPMGIDRFRRLVDRAALEALVGRERESPCRILDEDHHWLVSCDS